MNRFDPLEIGLGLAFVGLLSVFAYLFWSVLSGCLDAVAPPLTRKRRQVPKDAPAELDVDGAVGPDGLSHFVVLNARRWPRFRQRVLLRIGGDTAPLVWVVAFTLPDGGKHFDYNLTEL